MRRPRYCRLLATARRALAGPLFAYPPPRCVAPAGYTPIITRCDGTTDVAQMPTYEAAIMATTGLVSVCRPGTMRAWKRATRPLGVVTLGRLRTAAIVHGARDHA